MTSGQNNYQICTRCIMDTSDPEISFNEEGICNHCQYFDAEIRPRWSPDEEGGERLEGILNKIRKEGQGKEYDCILGISGGIDSSYLAYKAKEWGLRPLIVHVDGGWNSELAVKNIETIVKKLDYDLYTYVVDWEEMKDLQLSFLKAGLANQDIPQDHAFFAKLYDFATSNDIKYVLNGGNNATESILPSSWGYNALDLKHIKAVHKKYGKQKLKKYPVISFYKYYFYFPFIKGMKIIRPLDYIPYNKDIAVDTLVEKLGWRYYGGKHHESRFTKFFQAYYLPKKFGYDKRRAHLSSEILAGGKTRQEALEEMAKPLYTDNELSEDINFIRKKLDLTEEEFIELLSAPQHSYKDFPSYENLIKIKNSIKRYLNA